MSNEEIASDIAPILFKFRKLDIPIPDGKSTDFAISTEEDFDIANKIAHACSKDVVDSPSVEAAFVQAGQLISKEFQFIDQGGGCDTIAGQLQNNNVANRDCKLPTFLLALVAQEIFPKSTTDIIFLKANIAHPYVRLMADGKTYFGHFAKPNPKFIQQASGFEILDDEKTKELENFIARDRANVYPPNAQGMKAIDELFLDV